MNFVFVNAEALRDGINELSTELRANASSFENAERDITRLFAAVYSNVFRLKPYLFGSADRQEGIIRTRF